MNFPKVVVKVSAAGMGSLTIDGKDVPASAISVRVRPGYLTRVFIALEADVEIEAEAEVKKQ